LELPRPTAEVSGVVVFMVEAFMAVVFTTGAFMTGGNSEAIAASLERCTLRNGEMSFSNERTITLGSFRVPTPGNER
jgi:hypothetical protein